MNLQLSLKTKWFEMTKAGIKTEDYREITPYWIKRLLLDVEVIDPSISYEDLAELIKEKSMHIKFGFHDFKTNTITLGYPKAGDKERILVLDHDGIEVRTGNTDWGAEPNKIYFVIKHGAINMTK